MPNSDNVFFYVIKIVDANGNCMTYGLPAQSSLAARKVANEMGKKRGLVLPFKVSIESDCFGNTLRRPVMTIPPVEQITTEEEARDLAIEWQHSQNDESMSYDEIHSWQSFFGRQVDRFPNLAEEFTENGIC